MKKNKIKYIFECTALKELTQFNKDWNKKIHDECYQDRDEVFHPDFICYENKCKHLKIHTYKGDK